MSPVKMRVLAFACAGSLLAFTGGASSALSPAQQEPASDSSAGLTEARDLNADDAIVEINLNARIAPVEIAPGKRVNAWTYDGGLPGPLIRARVGTRLIVHFKNDLPKPTTVHWHGVRVPIEMDGVPDISQPEVPPGGSFMYDFILKDAGLFWYHPHVMSAAQVGFGLYGPLLVEDPADGVNVAEQRTLVLSDIGFNKQGVLEPAESGESAGMVFGREGEYPLVNGRLVPAIRVRSGAPQRWRIVNAAKSRFFLLDLDGQPFVKIGADGGLLEQPVASDVLLITPGERADVIVAPAGKPGSTLMMRALLYNRGYGSVEYRSVEDLLALEFTTEAPVKAARLPTVARAIVPPAPAGATRVDIELTLPPQDGRGHSEFRVNGKPFWSAAPYTAKLGETQLWVIRNQTKWDHPFHLHGYFFMPVDESGAPLRPMQWKDTINVPMESTVRFLVTFDERPGEWMFHCHILDHADGGLMGTVRVGSPPLTTHVHRSQ